MTDRLSDLKKELSLRDKAELVQLCVRFARLKQENKELLAYLLFDADDPVFYAQKLKPEIEAIWEQPFYNPWAMNKSLRKALRIIARYRRFTASARGENDLLLHLFLGMHAHWRPEFRQKIFGKMLYRQISKIKKNIAKMESDYQSDYEEPLRELQRETERRFGSETQYL